MEEIVEELLSFVESDAEWWNKVAQNCPELVSKVGGDEEARLLLLCEGYRERAKVHEEMIAKVRQRLEGDRHGRVIESRSKIRPVYSLTTYHLSLISVTPVASDAAFFQASASP
jgi:hypothetical protein